MKFVTIIAVFHDIHLYIYLKSGCAAVSRVPSSPGMMLPASVGGAIPDDTAPYIASLQAANPLRPRPGPLARAEELRPVGPEEHATAIFAASPAPTARDLIPNLFTEQPV